MLSIVCGFSAVTGNWELKFSPCSRICEPRCGGASFFLIHTSEGNSHFGKLSSPFLFLYLENYSFLIPSFNVTSSGKPA